MTPNPPICHCEDTGTYLHDNHLVFCACEAGKQAMRERLEYHQCDLRPRKNPRRGCNNWEDAR